METNFRQVVQYHEELGHINIPNQRACMMYGNRNYFIQTDENGFRNSNRNAEGALKILLLGDSYTAGYGVNNEHRFSDLLEIEYDCKTINLAVSGYGVDQQVLAYKKYGKHIDHDIVIFVPFLDDLTRSCLKARIGLQRSTGKRILIPKPYFLLKNGQLELRNVPVPKDRKLFVEDPEGTSAGHRLAAAPRHAEANAPEWEINTPLIRYLRELAADKPLLIFPLPMNESVIANDPPVHIPLFRRFEDDNTFVYDISNRLQEEYDYASESVYLKICGHFSKTGHQLVAREMGRILERQFQLAKREKPLGRVVKGAHVLGISCFYHDSAACLIRDGAVVAAAQEERFSRIKHDKSFPVNAVNYCLEAGDIRVEDLEAVVYYDLETWTIERVLHNALQLAADKDAYWQLARKSLYKKLKLPQLIRNRTGYAGEIYKTQHHISHAAGAYYPSPFKEAAILVIDGVGEHACTTIARGRGSRIEVLKQQFYPHSLGLLYSAFTYFTGFKVNSGEYKLMGLAPFGDPVYADAIKKHLINLKEDGSILLNMGFFDFQNGEKMTGDKFNTLFGGPPRQPESPITKREMDLAASIQQVTEEIVIRMANHAFELTGCTNLAMAGGVALNCVANGQLFDQTPFKDFYFQPAAGDAGGAMGCALSWYFEHYPDADKQAAEQESALLGPSFTPQEIGAFLNSADLPHHRFVPEKRAETIAGWLYENKVVGHFDGRMEFGPRALGARSILGNPLAPEMQSTLNLKIKYRESFRPFAPIFKEERTADYFDFHRPSPHMLVVRQVRASLLKPQKERSGENLITRINQVRSEIPAITHVDNSARLQSVNSRQNRRIHEILDEFEKLSGKGILINTSFNVRGEPIVGTPMDAYRCFMRTEMDVLVLGDFYLIKNEQPVFQEEQDWQKQFELD
ncbi:MAG TPA: carbamoyltransferase N-terminal domain-containing protein [Flavilitoribacter sp.]|nr:carbamoyltransferase N-terminal domain-containing protein [Flavilitoribacter sp.]